MLAATPPMGWNSWNTFGPIIDQNMILETADAILETGLLDVGYRYVVIDDGWMAEERVDGCLAPHPERFSMGIAGLAEEVHDRGLLLGVYSGAGTHTCEGFPASYGYEEVDASTFAEWGVDFLKYDFCYAAPGSDPVALYRRMGQALRATGREIVYSVCEWGVNRPWEWGAVVGAHMWRTTSDIQDSWESVSQIGFGLQADLHPYAGPGRWNDPDMLVVGMKDIGHVAGGGLTEAEYRSHFALWCLLAAPLMIGCDVRSMDDFTRSLLADADLIGINQDSLGRQGYRVGAGLDHAPAETWAKPLADGSWAVGFFNTGDMDQRLMSIGWQQLGLALDGPADVYNLATEELHPAVTRSYTTRVESHGAHVIRVTPAGRPRYPGDQRLTCLARS